MESPTRRVQLLDAAGAFLCTHGVNTSLELVVEHADVGRATLSQQFPNRHALLFALMAHSIAHLQDRARGMSDRTDGFFMLLQYLTDRVVHSPALSDCWRSTGHQRDPRFAPLRTQAWETFAPALAHAKAERLLRADVVPSDLSLLSGMLGAALRATSAAERKGLALHPLDLITGGLRPRGCHTAHHCAL